MPISDFLFKVLWCIKVLLVVTLDGVFLKMYRQLMH